MRFKFKATANAFFYTIDGEIINQIDLSALNHGDQFVGNDETESAGILNAERDGNGELWVTLQQAPPITRISFMVEGRKKPITLRPEQIVRDGSELILSDDEGSETRYAIIREIEHRGGDWTESDWINASIYNPNTLYIKEV